MVYLATDTNHMLDIVQSFRYPICSSYRFVFTMDIKSLYTVIPNNDGFVTLRHFLNKLSALTQPIVHLAELVLTLKNSFTLDGSYYRQTNGVPMGIKLGPNYACLLVGQIEEQIFLQYPRNQTLINMSRTSTRSPSSLGDLWRTTAFSRPLP